MNAPAKWLWTRHALLRCAEMGLQPSLVEDVLQEPLKDYPSRGGCRVRCGAGLAIVFDVLDAAIVTILWDGRDRRWPSPSNFHNSIQGGAP